MKRITFFVLFLVLVFASFAQNLVINPRFDTWVSLTKPTGWAHIENCLKDSSFFISEDYSCKHSGGASTTSDLGQTINVISGKRYTLSLFYKTAITSTGNGARIWCYWKDIAGVNITDTPSDAILRPTAYLKSDAWQQYTITATAPSGATAFYLEVRTYTNSIAYWDDFVFEENLSTLNPGERLTDIAIYPNPAHDYLIINNIQNIMNVNIQNSTGMIIWSSKYSGEEKITIPVSGFVDGIYIISIRTIDKLITQKFIKKATSN